MKIVTVLLLALASSASSAYDIVDSNSIDDDYSAGAIAVNAATAESGEEEEEEQYYDEEEGLFLGSSVLVNGVQSSEIPHVLDSLRKVRTAVKQQAFAALSAAVGRRRRTLQQTRGLIDAMKRILEEHLNGLAAVRKKVERILRRILAEGKQESLISSHRSSQSLASSSLSPSEAFFLTNVRDSVPDILRFTHEQFEAVAAIY